MGDEQAALLAQIRALSGAIDQRKSTPSYSRGGYRGRGRGGPIVGPRNASRHRSLVLSGPAVTKGATVSHDKAADLEKVGTGESSQTGEAAWVKRKSTHNMSLVSKKAFDQSEPARLAALAASQDAKASAVQAKRQAKAAHAKAKGEKNSIRRGDKMGEVVIDGVVFQFDESGTKLIKKDPQPNSETPESPTKSETPLQTSVDGQRYVRTKTGNLISKDLLEKREARKKLQRLGDMGKDIGMRQRGSGRAVGSKRSIRKRGLCSFYNKTGQCKRGLSCPYMHNPGKVAICPGILRPTGCTLPAGSCPLSHDKRPERVPHCVHFLRLGSCRNGEECYYTHPDAGVHLTNDSPICIDFSDLGWCQRGSACPERHTWDCPDFLRTGTCSRKGCKLMHVIRGENLKSREEEAHIADEDLFVRDDGAAAASEDETELKRKRSDSEDLDAKEQEDVNPFWRAKKTKDFARQEEFISLGDDGLDDDEEDSGEEDVDEEGEDDDDQSSVHSDSSVE